jgi:hypothetical protein
METKTVIDPSIMKSHLREIRIWILSLQEYLTSIPRAPFKPDCTPAPTRPPKPPERRLPAYKIEVLRANSSLVYQLESRNRAPGK